MVKRSMNRAPGPNDLWWNEHMATCGGTYYKIKEPENYMKKKKEKEKKTESIKLGKPFYCAFLFINILLLLLFPNHSN